MSLVAGDALVVGGVELIPILDVSVRGDVDGRGGLAVVASSTPVALVVRTAQGDHALDALGAQTSLADLVDATPALGVRLTAAGPA